MEESHKTEDSKHSHEHSHSTEYPGRRYKWFFTILFIPLCLFAISHYITKQIGVRGASYIGFNIYADAARQYRKVVFINKNDMESWYYLGYSYRMLGEYEKAVDVYKQILTLDHQNLNATHDLAMSYAMKGDYKVAIKTFRDLEKMILTTDRLNPNEKLRHHEKTIALLVTCYEKLGNLDQARLVIQEYLKTHPNSLAMKEKLMQIGKNSVSDKGIDSE